MLLRNLAIGIGLVSLIATKTLAQEQAPAEPADVAAIYALPPQYPQVYTNPFGATLASGQFSGLTGAIAGIPADQDLHKAMEKYQQSASDSDARAESKDEIQKALGEQYDAYLEEQEQQLDAMEKKLAELRDQLKQRSAAKQKMVDLKFEMVLAQLEGLGWPESNEGWLGGAVQRRYWNGSRGSLNPLTTEPGAPIPSLLLPRATGGGESRSTPPRNRGGSR